MSKPDQAELDRAELLAAVAAVIANDMPDDFELPGQGELTDAVMEYLIEQELQARLAGDKPD